MRCRMLERLQFHPVTALSLGNVPSVFKSCGQTGEIFRSSHLDPRVIVNLYVNTCLCRAIDKESNKTSTVLNIVKGLCWFENPVVLFLQEKLILPNVLRYEICIQNRNEDNSQPAECLFESCTVGCCLFQLSAVSSSCRRR